ncbi:MAG TPA: hypothetical protein DHV28_11345 [Ignavibacteriales bacterium]|nr:hypothetical protein [Ignavibacteriales bacterium]
MFSIQQEIDNQKAQESPKLKPIKPLEHPVQAAQHTPVYKMHRYYARRPWNVFENIIKHYTEPGDIILDPFCGGGVTVVEALKLRRKVVGVDLNPLATFITEMEITQLDINKFIKAFEEVKKSSADKIKPLYKTKCLKCKKDTFAEWFEWSNVFECPICHQEVILANAKKPKAGVYICTNKKCKQAFKPSETIKIKEVPINLLVDCNCGYKGLQKLTDRDFDLLNEIDKNFSKIVKKEKLWYPTDEFPDGDLEKDHGLFKKGIKYFSDLFTKRNLLANSFLLKAIQLNTSDEITKKFIYMCFSNSLRFTNRMVAGNPNWRGGNPEWGGHAYWQPNVFNEVNVYSAFSKLAMGIVRGKEFSNQTIGDFFSISDSFNEIQENKTVNLYNRSSHKLPLPENSIDAVITDPPFGGNVQYAELSDFWVIWLKDILKKDGIIDNKYEAIQTRHSGFESAKDEKHYEEMLYKIFKECHRVLKPNGYMVLTFHNKDISVWMSLHRAANRAGFKLPSEDFSENRGIIYQPPIQNYTQTFHTKASGSMLGDFILSFQRIDTIDDAHKISSMLSQEQEKKLVDKIESLLVYHGGADENTLMTVLVPFLMNEIHVFTDVANFNFESFLKKYFSLDSKQKKWFTKEQFTEYYDPKTKRLRPIDFVKAEEFSYNVIVSLLKQRHFVTVDELLSEVYTKLVNSHRPGIEAVNKVLDKYCEMYEDKKSKKKGYRLKTDFKPKEKIDKPYTIDQLGLFGEDSNTSNLSHNEIIQLVAHFALELGYKVHVGKTEQNKEKDFRIISSSMQFKEDFGIANANAFKKIKEIDLLILEGYEVPAVFEVTTSIDTAREAINDRFRDLFTILPNTKINAFVIVKDVDYNKAKEMLNSAANKKDKLNSRIRIIKVSELTKQFINEILKS